MSFDTKLSKVCDHREISEDHSVEPIDNKTIYLDMPVSSLDNIVVRYNNVPLNKNNDIELLDNENATSQVTGTNSIFVVKNIPITDGSNKRRVATGLFDTIVRVFITDDDVSGQFTGIEKVLITQHRPLMSRFNVFADRLTTADIQVKVNGNPVDIISIEPVFGKIALKDAPPTGSTVTVTYVYRARVQSIDGNAGSITIKEKPQIGQTVLISYYHSTRDGWQVIVDRQTQLAKIILDKEKQTNRKIVIDENVSSQFSEQNTTRFYTKYKPIIPLKAKLTTSPIETSLTHISVKINGVSTLPVNIDANKGLIDLGFIPESTDIITITYNCRDDEAPTDVFSIDYSTVQKHCRKCRRLSVLNDFSYNNLGQTVKVEKEEKMLQDLLKMSTAIKGSNKAHPWYGTSFTSFIGTARLPQYYTMKFKSELIDAGNKMKDLQNQQTQYQIVDDEEFFNFMNNISVVQNDEDPNYYEVNAVVISQASTAIELTTDIMVNQGTKIV